jgi:glycosyltransferase involved in cell wall biosynthesis
MIVNLISPHASCYHGGMESVTINMARFLSENGNIVRLVTRKSGKETDTYQSIKYNRNKNLQIIEIELPSTSPFPDGTWDTFYRLSCEFGARAYNSYVSLTDADIFSFHLLSDLLFAPDGVNAVVHLHGNPDKVDLLISASMQKVRTSIAHSRSIRSWWKREFNKLEPELFYNGIDTKLFNGEVVSNRPIDVLYVGRYLEHKGAQDIIMSANKYHKVVFAGNGPYLSILKKLAKEYDLRDYTFFDTPSTSTIIELYKNSKIFVCPSRSKEGLLTTLLEAGASGCAVITTKGSGMTDLINNRINGIVVDPGSVSDLSLAITELLHDEELRCQLAESLRLEINGNWNWRYKAVELERIYEKFL